MIILRLKVNNFKQLKDIDIKFPERGTFLIEGDNESGKSSLFESVYFGLFGLPLSVGKIEDLINYQTDYCSVELWIAVKERIYQISRKIFRKKPNLYKLSIYQNGMLKELITKNKAVNQKIQQELCIDPYALLNSCFVEQKKLDKLEGMDKQQREKALMKLLNLDELLAAQEDFKVKTEHQKEILTQEKRVKLAEFQEKLPELMKNFKILKNSILLLQKQEKEENIERLKKEVCKLKKELASITQSLEEARRIEKEILLFERFINLLTEVGHLKKREEEINETLEKIKDIKKDLEKKSKMIKDIIFVGIRLKRMKKIQEYLDKLREKQKILLDYEMKKNELAEISKKLKEVNQKIMNFKILKDIEDLMKYKDTLKELKEFEDERRKKESQLQEINLFLKRQKRAFRLIFVFKIPLVLVVFGLSFKLTFLLPLSLPIIGFFFFLILNKRKKLLKIKQRQRDIEKDLEKLLIKREILNADELQEKLLICQENLKKLKIFQDDLNQIIQNFKKELKDSEFPVLERQKEDFEKRNYELVAYLQLLKEKQQSLNLDDNKNPDILIEKAQRIIQNYLPKLKQKASSLNIPLDREKLLELYSSLNTEIKKDKIEIKKQKEFLKEKEVLSVQKEELEAQINQMINSLPYKEDILNQNLYEKEFFVKKKEQKEKELESRKLEKLQKQKEDLLKEIERRESQINTLTKEIQLLEKEIDTSIIDESKIIKDDSFKLKELLEKNNQQIGFLEGSIKELSEELKEDKQLSLKEEQKIYKALRLNLEVIQVCYKILQDSRLELIKKVLPNTNLNLQKILPLLTNNRYHDGFITEDYKIMVWDSLANKYCQKDVFSGGTKDQFSLALRLAFAIATLPQEREISPSFIFLDEPLSSFDTQRAEAFLELVTKGEIFSTFSQIFIISHIYTQREKFMYYIKLQEGRISQTNLQ